MLSFNRFISDPEAMKTAAKNVVKTTVKKTASLASKMLPTSSQGSSVAAPHDITPVSSYSSGAQKNESVQEEKKGLYYYVNRRKRLGISRDKDDPRAPSDQDFKNAAKTAKENFDPEAQFDMIEEMIEALAAERNIDSDALWEELESVSDEELIAEVAAWQKKEGKSESGGLNAKGVASYRRENPGSKLQMAVTTKPSKLKKDSKAYKRRKSFCARMSGVEGPMKDERGRPTRKALALRKWNC